MTYYDSNRNEYYVSNRVLYASAGSSGTGVMQNFSSSTNLATSLGITEPFSSVVMDATITVVGSYAFKTNTSVTYVSMTGATRIRSYAFYNCYHLVSFDAPALTTIDDNVFKDCTALAMTSLPSTLLTINDYAFCGCTGLTKVTIMGTTRLYSYVFDDCTALAKVYVKSTEPSTVGSLVFPNNPTVIYVPEGTLSAYQSAWSAYSSQLQEASSTTAKVNVSGTWKSGVPYVNVNGTWKAGELYVNVNGTWKKGA